MLILEKEKKGFKSNDLNFCFMEPQNEEQI